MNIRRVLTAAVLATGIAAFAGPAFAGPISGSIDVSGLSAGVMTSGTTATITFINPGNIVSVSGAFDELMTRSSTATQVCMNCVNLGQGSPPTFSTSDAAGFQLFTATNNNITVTLDTETANFLALSNGGGYQVYGNGMLNLPGYTSTSGAYDMTIPSTGVNASVDIYSSVPEPGTLALFGAGLLGFAVFASRRRRSTKPLA